MVEIGGAEPWNAALHTVRNEGRRNPEPGADLVDDALRDADPRMRKLHSHPLTGAQHRLRHPSPFLALVIETVMRHHDAKAEQAGERRQKRRPDRMDMNEIRIASGGGEQT